MTAEEQPVGKLVLPCAYDRHQPRPTVLIDQRVEANIGLGALRPVQIVTGINIMHCGIRRIIGQCLAEVDVVAVNIDVVFVNPSHPRGAPGVNQVNHQDGNVIRQFTGSEHVQPSALAVRSVVALDTMGAAYCHQYPLGFRISQKRHICTEFLPERP
ncbi:hypothetical protein D3C85_1006480 [compost metagenome]